MPQLSYLPIDTFNLHPGPVLKGKNMPTRSCSVYCGRLERVWGKEIVTIMKGHDEQSPSKEPEEALLQEPILLPSSHKPPRQALGDRAHVP